MNELLNDYAIWSHSDMDKVATQLNEWTKSYDEGNPQISDEEWDKWYFELLNWEQATHYYPSHSPTQNISYQVVNELKKVEHNHPMLSLDKTKNIIEVDNFVHNHTVLIMTKCDGLTCSLRYLNGKLISAETRGNGYIGEDITHNALVIPSIPNKINYKDELIVDGEIVCLESDFQKFANDYKNPRNFAAGSIRLLDSNECAKRNLTFIVWDVIKGFDNYHWLSNKLDACNHLGFQVVPWIQHSTFDEFLLQDIIEMSEDIPYDGIVVKYDDIKFGKSLGETAHHFKNAIAYKLYDEEYETELMNIDWQVGRTGQITPVAIFNPVEIDGSIISRASLHNMSILMETLGSPYKGQKIWIYKANMIVPQIARADKREILPTEQFAFPQVCPICGKMVTINLNNDVTTIWCNNPNCEGKFINRLEHFCGKSGLDIRGLSKATLGKLIDEFWISKLEDIFNLEQYRSLWVKMPGFGPTSVNNILTAIENSKTTTLEKFICAIGIPQIGRSASKQLAEYFKSYEAFRNAINNKFDFTKLPDMGDITALKILNFNYEEADNIYYQYLNIPEVEIIESSNKLQNKKFVITGSIKHYKNRNELKSIIEKEGGKVLSAISSNVDYLINNDINSSSSKNVSAKKLGIPIISEEEFLKFLD